MLQIENLDYYNEVIKLAKEHEMYEPNENVDGSLKERLEYLDKYAETNRGDTRCILFKDFAPMSFEFVMQKKGPDGEYKRWFNGGLIFHQAHDSGAGAPTFSVRLGNNKKSGWSIHT